jgi:hypothetical protein
MYKNFMPFEKQMQSLWAPLKEVSEQVWAQIYKLSYMCPFAL